MSPIEFWTMAYALTTIIIMVIVGASAWWAKGQLEEVKRARQLDCLTTLSEKWSSDLIREARRITDAAGANFDEIWKTLETESSEDYFKLAALANFFEDLAILEKEGQITFEQVSDRFGPALTYYHGVLAGIITEHQKEDARVLENFDALAKRIEETTTS